MDRLRHTAITQPVDPLTNAVVVSLELNLLMFYVLVHWQPPLS